jgi:glycosyltransferase involved in cell wall biosynthesis
MKIAFITFGKIQDIKNWSGAIRSMFEVVKSGSHEIIIIERIEKSFFKPTVLIYKLLEKTLRRSFQIERMPTNLKRIASHIENVLEGSDVDLLFSPSSLPFSYLKSHLPKVIWTDATFKLMIHYYPDYMALTNKVIAWGNRQEALALKNVDLAFYTSEWAANSAIEDYKVDACKIRIIPFGPNIKPNISHSEFVQIIENRIQDDSIKLLSIGANWKRKGFDLTLMIAQEISNQGYKVELSIVGASPPKKINPNFTYHHYGRLLYTDPVQSNLLNKLYKESHFFVLPSTAECAGIVFAEASSFALPSITRKTGGIPTMIENGINGFVFEYDVAALEYANKIIELFIRKDDYKKLCFSTLERFSKFMSWARIIELFNKYISEI